jgi:hypothetical protein
MLRRLHALCGARSDCRYIAFQQHPCTVPPTPSHEHLQPASISWTDARRFARIFRFTLWDGVEMTKEQVKTISADVFEAYTHR